MRNYVVCVVARLAFVFYCALTTGRCNAFQHIFGNKKKSEFYGPYFQTMLFLVTMTQPSKKFILNLHFNGDDSYLFVNGKQELKFKAKTSHLVKEKFCIGNLTDKWTTSESEKTGLHGNIYNFVVDYEQILGVKAIHDMHRYLMIKHNISL